MKAKGFGLRVDGLKAGLGVFDGSVKQAVTEADGRKGPEPETEKCRTPNPSLILPGLRSDLVLLVDRQKSCVGCRVKGAEINKSLNDEVSGQGP